MNVILENPILKAIIDTKGAEVKELIFKANNKLISHDVSTDSWKRVAPVLFPIVSRLPNNRYVYQGKEYIIPGHGFARDMEFVADKCTPARANFTLQASSQTIKMYPFNFKLQISYYLLGKRLNVTYTVTNNDEHKPMYYMIGGHPGFKFNFKSGVFKFEMPERPFQILLDKQMYITDKSVAYFDNKDTLLLQRDLFRNDALIFSKFQSKTFALKEREREIEFTMKGFPYLALWSSPNTDDNFICIEPWDGIRVNMTDELDKMGTIRLEPGESKQYSYGICIKEIK